jgi:hypothetical protein
MSEKSVGADWKKKVIYTLRHAAGAEKYRTLKKWENRREAYEARVKAKAEKLAFKVKSKNTSKPKNKIVIKGKRKRVIVKGKVAENDKKNRRKTTINGGLKKEK